MECCFCKKQLEKKNSNNKFPICNKKDCVKKFVKFFSCFCQKIDKETGTECEGFFFNNILIRFNYFEADFEKAWKLNKGVK